MIAASDFASNKSDDAMAEASLTRCDPSQIFAGEE